MPSINGHRKAKNMYFSGYGDIWVEKLKFSSSVSKLLCINDLILFIIKEEEKLTNGSVNEDDLFIVYDDLMLMTVKETITWMKENNYLHHWLLPMNIFQYGTNYYVSMI